MITRWSSHIKDKEKRKTFEAQVRSASTVLGRLTEIIDSKIDTLDCPSQTDYTEASWAYLQADRNGQLRSLLELRKLTDLSQEDKDHV